LIFASLFLLIILSIRTIGGLDLTDEMQYYGEIKGLIDKGRLFSNDLFLQQTVYILLYPAFYVYHHFFGFDGLVFFGRFLIATLSLGIFFYSHKKLLEFKFPPLIAIFTALSLTFAIPYNSSLSPSYNNISQVLWIIFTIMFFEWKSRRAFSWATLIILMAFAHQTSAITMLFLFLVRLIINRGFVEFAKVSAIFFVPLLLGILAILNFGTINEFKDSIIFSSGFGVGKVFFSYKNEQIILIIICTLFISSILFYKHLQKIDFNLLSNYLLGFFILLSLSGYIQQTSFYTVLLLSLLGAFSYAQSILKSSKYQVINTSHIHWLAIMLLFYIATLGITSGNGIRQGTGALMVCCPLFLAKSLSSESASKRPEKLFKKNLSVLLLLIFYMLQWARYPYREDFFWKTTNFVKTVPEFKFISTSNDRLKFINQIKNELYPYIYGKKTLIVSSYPGLYFITGADIETCMLFMHSASFSKSFDILQSCLNKKNPEIILDIYSDNDLNYYDPSFKTKMSHFYERRGFICNQKIIALDAKPNLNPTPFKYRLCKIPGF
jgi:hypothetical protein